VKVSKTYRLRRLSKFWRKNCLSIPRAAALQNLTDQIAFIEKECLAPLPSYQTWTGCRLTGRMLRDTCHMTHMTHMTRHTMCDTPLTAYAAYLSSG